MCMPQYPLHSLPHFRVCVCVCVCVCEFKLSVTQSKHCHQEVKVNDYLGKEKSNAMHLFLSNTC